MSVQFDDIVNQGYLKMKSKGLGTWKRKWIILRKSSSRGPACIEHYRDETASLSAGIVKKVIYFRDVSTVSKLPNDVRKHSIAVILSDNLSKQYAAESDHESFLWQQLFQAQLDCYRSGLRAGPSLDLLPGETSDTFSVKLLPSSALSIFGECLLQVTTEFIYLYDVDEPDKLLVHWPITSLRRYGKDDNRFTIEAGRRCDTGEGLFVFNTHEYLAIYDKVHKASQSLAAALRICTNENLNSSMTNNNFLARSISIQARSPPVVNTNTDQPIRGFARSIKEPLSASVRSLPALPPPLPDRPPLPLPNEQACTAKTYQNLPAGHSANSTKSYNQLPMLNHMTTPSVSDRQNNNNERPEIYEEKYLSPAFKDFLYQRKKDDGE